MTDLAILQTWLSEAETARHKLITGALFASVGYQDHQVTFARTEIGKLDAYITSLRAQIADQTGSGSRVRPIHLTF